MNESMFDDAYRRLNNEQKKAVDTIEGPVMVIAGPGTGKTQILTLRIANILLKTDTKPENILALTFTESGARAMRERLARYIGAPAYRVPIHTFHEFAGKCMRRFPDAYGRSIGGRPLSDLERITLIESILETPEVATLRPHGNPQFYVGPVLHALSLMKKEWITPDDFAHIISSQEDILKGIEKIHVNGAHKGKVRGEYLEREKALMKNRALLFVYRAYEALLAENHYVDFDDMIFETVRALEMNEDMLRILQEEYQYILADEHQDVNGSQNKILELLASYHERPNIFVVGDEKQSIYRFQGASLENFLYFEEKFPHTTTVALTNNYRSCQSILDLSHELIKIDEGPAAALRVPLTAWKKEEGVIERRAYSHEAVEHEYLVTSLRALIERGVEEDEIAIILRTNREVDEVTEYLRNCGIHAESSSDSDILTHPLTATVRMLIKAVVNIRDERALFEILHTGFVGLGGSDLINLLGARSYTTTLSHIIESEERLVECGVVETEKVLRIARALKGARDRVGEDAPHRVLEYLLRETGFLEYTMARDPMTGTRIIRRLYDQVEEMVHHNTVVTLLDVEEMFATCVLHTISLNAPYIHTGGKTVRVMTAHKAKGLEFEHVFIPHLTDQKWGGRSKAEYFKIPITKHLSPDAFDKEDDERKLLYVALTRAKTGLYLSHSTMNRDGKELVATRLLEGLGEGLVRDVSTVKEESLFNPIHAITIKDAAVPFDTTFLKSTFAERGFSATALNNYLRDPWNYFYRNVLHIPEVQPESAQFGTVLHSALERSFAYRRVHGKLPDVGTVKLFLEQSLERLPITTTEYVRHHERGLQVLLSYLAHIERSLPHETKEEYGIQAILQTGNSELPEILLTGKLDRLDFDENGILVRVVDYKTGKPRTRGYIEGTTKDSTGDYKRQLTFYALLLSLHGGERLKCSHGVLSFIEPDEKGLIHEEAYTITDEEVELLKSVIIRSALEITEGTFLHVPCDPLKSDYCYLASEFQKKL